MLNRHPLDVDLAVDAAIVARSRFSFHVDRSVALRIRRKIEVIKRERLFRDQHLRLPQMQVGH